MTAAQSSPRPAAKKAGRQGGRPRPVAPPADLAGDENPPAPADPDATQPDDGLTAIKQDVATMMKGLGELTQTVGQLAGIVLSQTPPAELAPPPVVEQETLVDQRAAKGYIRFFSPYKKYGIAYVHGHIVTDNQGRVVHREPQRNIVFEDGIHETRDADEIEFLRQQIADGNHDLYEAPTAQRDMGVEVQTGARGIVAAPPVDERPIRSMVEGSPPIAARL